MIELLVPLGRRVQRGGRRPRRLLQYARRVMRRGRGDEAAAAGGRAGAVEVRLLVVEVVVGERGEGRGAVVVVEVGVVLQSVK